MIDVKKIAQLPLIDHFTELSYIPLVVDGATYKIKPSVIVANGVAGTSGTSGIDGTSGTSGEAGTNGEAGTSGTSGTDGQAGSSGEAGTSGTSGTSSTTLTLEQVLGQGNISKNNKWIELYDSVAEDKGLKLSYDQILGYNEFTGSSFNLIGNYLRIFKNYSKKINWKNQDKNGRERSRFKIIFIINNINPGSNDTKKKKTLKQCYKSA